MISMNKRELWHANHKNIANKYIRYENFVIVITKMGRDNHTTAMQTNALSTATQIQPKNPRCIHIHEIGLHCGFICSS